MKRLLVLFLSITFALQYAHAQYLSYEAQKLYDEVKPWTKSKERPDIYTLKQCLEKSEKAAALHPDNLRLQNCIALFASQIAVSDYDIIYPRKAIAAYEKIISLMGTRISPELQQTLLEKIKRLRVYEEESLYVMTPSTLCGRWECYTYNTAYEKGYGPEYYRAPQYDLTISESDGGYTATVYTKCRIYNYSGHDGDKVDNALESSHHLYTEGYNLTIHGPIETTYITMDTRHDVEDRLSGGHIKLITLQYYHGELTGILKSHLEYTIDRWDKELLRSYYRYRKSLECKTIEEAKAKRYARRHDAYKSRIDIYGPYSYNLKYIKVK